jgi:hypothetical protein
LAWLRPATRAELAATRTPELENLPRYRLNLTLGDDLTVLTLTEEVTYTNTEAAAVPDLAFRVFANRTSQPPPVAINAAECDPAPCQLKQESSSAWRVVPQQPIAPGSQLRVRLNLAGKLRIIAAGETDMMQQSLSGLSGLFSAPSDPTDYGLLSYGDGIASLANFHALLATRRQGKWLTSERTTMGDLGSDEMALVQAWVTTPSDVQIAATGATKLEVPGKAHHTFSVAAGLIRDFAVYASRQFVSVSRDVGDVSVRSYCVRGDEAAGLQVLDVASEALKEFEARFGPYPYRALSVVEAPVVGGAGGVEFSGLVTVASMFYRPPAKGIEQLLGLMGAGGDFQRSALEFTTAHELAHQYWHGLVGSDSREHAFEDESMAQWSTLLYLEDRYGAARAQADAGQHVLMNYRMMRLLGQPDGAVDRPVDNFPSSIAYAGLVYGKGPFLYSALRKAVGNTEFFEGLRRYVTRYKFQIAPSSGFFDELARVPRHAAEVRRLSARYLRQAHGDQDLRDLGSPDDPMSKLLAQLGGAQGLGNLLGARRNGKTSAGLSSDAAPLELLQQLLKGLAPDGAGKAPAAPNLMDLLN